MSIKFMHNVAAIQLLIVAGIMLSLGYDYIVYGQGIHPLFAGVMTIATSTLAGLLFNK